MTLKELSSLAPEYEEAVWNLLVLADREFVPPLSSRNSTQQTSFHEKDSAIFTNQPYAYFETLRAQNFIIAVANQTIVGFLSYIPDYTLPIMYNNEELTANYVSTIIVDPVFRGQGITQMLYRELMKKNFSIATRTWSTNTAHISILQKLNFTNILSILDDRGPGIDTIYFYRKY